MTFSSLENVLGGIQRGNASQETWPCLITLHENTGGRSLTMYLCPSVTTHTFSPHHLQQVSRWQSLTAAGQEEAGEAFGPIPPSSPFDSQASVTTFYIRAARVLPKVCGLGQPELWLILQDILAHRGAEP